MNARAVLTAMQPAANAPASAWAARITACWRASVEAILEVGRLLEAAKEALPHGEFGKMIEAELPFGDRTARMLMTIAGDPRLTDRKHASVLPAHWGTLYELTKFDDEKFEQAVEQKIIRPDMERRDVKVMQSRERRTTRESELGQRQQALPQSKFGIIYADPPWHFEVWSEERGVEKSAQNQYPTLTVEEICALPVKDIVADDALLFLWITSPRLFRAPEIFAAWSPGAAWVYVTHYVWDKEKIATGYWNRNRHELLLIAKRGNVPPPLPEQLEPSVYREASTRHSAKPVHYCELIERQFPSLPKIELFRRGPSRPGWAAWGNETVSRCDPSDQHQTPAANESKTLPSNNPAEHLAFVGDLNPDAAGEPVQEAAE